MRKRWLIPVLILAAVAAVLMYYRLAGNERERSIRLPGNIEIDPVQVSFKLPGRLEKRLAGEGDHVTAGDLLGVLESEEVMEEAGLQRAAVDAAKASLDELEAGSRSEEIARADAAVRRSEARLAELEAGPRQPEIAVAEAALAGARADLARLDAELKRQQILLSQDVISLREFQAVEAAREMASSRFRDAGERVKLLREGTRTEQLVQARESLNEARQQYKLIRQGPRAETIRQARARLEQAKQGLALAETRLANTKVYAPVSGWVLTKGAEPGEFLAAGAPLLTVGNLERVWLRGYLGETELGRVKLGAEVKVTNDSHPGKIYRGRLVYIANYAEFTPKSVQTEEVRVKLVYRIKVEIENPGQELKPGMPADAEITLAEAQR